MNALAAQGVAADRAPAFGHVALNFAVFQAGWFACVLGAANGHPWIAPATVATAIALHLALATAPAIELKLIVVVTLSGALWDSMLTGLGWLVYPSGSIFSGAAPYWIAALWALYATTLNVSMRWLHKRTAIAALFGLIGGPLAYWGAQKLGAVTFAQPLAATVALAVGWALLMPLTLALARQWDGMARQGEPAA
jgi:hypothetical protein